MANKEQVYGVGVRANLNYSEESVLKVLDTLYSKDFWKKFKRLSKEGLFRKIYNGAHCWIPLTAKHIKALRDINDKLVRKGVPPVISMSSLQEIHPIVNLESAVIMVSLQEHVNNEDEYQIYAEISVIYEGVNKPYCRNVIFSSWCSELPDTLNGDSLAFADQVLYYGISEMFEENIDHVIEGGTGCYIIDKDGVGMAEDYESGNPELDSLVERSIPHALR